MEVYNKIKQKIRKHVSSAKGRRQVIFYTGVVVLAFLFFAVVWLIQFGPIGNTLSQEIQKTERDSLTGVLIEQRTELKQVYGVMIDEHTDARSQSGIDQAFLVIEAPVEAGIPRLLSFFSEAQDVKKIGPVRSARPYFLDWAKEFGALYAHVGGSDEALENHPNRPGVSLASANETAALIESILNELSPHERACVEFYYFDDLTFREIGEVLAISEDAASSIVRRAKEKIKTRLEQKDF